MDVQLPAFDISVVLNIARRQSEEGCGSGAAPSKAPTPAPAPAPSIITSLSAVKTDVLVFR